MQIYGKKVNRLTVEGLTDALNSADNNCCRDVSRGHSSWRNEPSLIDGGLTNQWRAESCSWIVNECYLLRFKLVRCSKLRLLTEVQDVIRRISQSDDTQRDNWKQHPPIVRCKARNCRIPNATCGGVRGRSGN